ncbi:DUF3164 family protein [Aliiroseovarius lamellibrachiae]|uniref:DUF3164 family protein n=1 Tax=Aliiroseovarius lamellibrachiae TaxID=1924933 RepID=UPI001BE0FBFE|nr:DUF3164 family protein [Aliiroseovarius lamellibrachiae]MBT2131204.1 DUF3164 family protein [Aliiroseovarius lamellibrachiae]
MTIQTPIPEGFMQDGQGRLVPVANVKTQDKLEDELVDRLCSSAIALSNSLKEFKKVALSEVFAFRELVLVEYNAKLGGKKGNMTLRTYDGRFELQIAIADRLVFGPQLQAAKALIDECLTRWSEGSNENLHAIVNDAFDVGKEGNIDTRRVLGLQSLKIEDLNWQKAMTAIKDAVRVDNTTTYIRFYRRDPVTGARTSILLDLAAIPVDLAEL